MNFYDYPDANLCDEGLFENHIPMRDRGMAPYIVRTNIATNVELYPIVPVARYYE